MTTPVTTLPADNKDGGEISVYDGFPSAPDRTALIKAFEGGVFGEGLLEDEGAPVGPFTTKSYRISRAVATIAQDGGHVTGGALAQGLVFAQWAEAPEGGALLKVTLTAPTTSSWGKGDSSALCQELAKTRCLQQYVKQVPNLLSAVSNLKEAMTVVPSFVGGWDESYRKLQERLIQGALAVLAREKADVALS